MGTGSVYEQHGRFTAKPPGTGLSSLGTFDTYEEADEAIERWIAERELREQEAAARGELAGEELARVTKLINGYLDGLEEGDAAVGLGALPGFPATTRDPDVVMRAAAEYQSRIAKAKSATDRLRTMQRVRDLKAAAERLRTDTSADNEKAFIQHGAAWAARYGVQYETFRDAG